MTTTEGAAALAELPIAPAADVTFRRFAGAADFPGMARANMVARAAYGIMETVTAESIAVQYRSLTNCDVERDLVIVDSDTGVRGYARIEWLDQNDGSRAYSTICILDPEVEGRGIGTALIEWQEARLRAIAADHPNDRDRWLECFAWDRNERAHHLLRGRGYVAARRGYEMLRADLDALPEVVVPDGLEIRPVGREDMRAIWEADNEAFRDHWGGIDASEEGWIRFRDEPEYEPELFVVAFDGAAIAGHVLNTIDPSDDEAQVRGLLDSVCVRRPWRRRGLARALIARSLHVLRDRGARSAYLGVDGENPNQAMSLYESAGFRITSSETTYRKPIFSEEATT
jgi:mycothiol synthase